MTVEELIEKLKKMPLKAEVSITDGFEAICYEGDFEVKTFEIEPKKIVCDIGVGGLNHR